jgi:hypothetical protein
MLFHLAQNPFGFLREKGIPGIVRILEVPIPVGNATHERLGVLEGREAQQAVSGRDMRHQVSPQRLGIARVSPVTAVDPEQAIALNLPVRKYFPPQDPIGKRIKYLGTPGSEPPWLTVIGVVADEKRRDFFRPMCWEEPPVVFRPVIHEPPSRAFMAFRSNTAGAALARTVQKQIQDSMAM